MNDAQSIVNALLEGDDEKPKKKMPAWLAKIKGEPVDDEEGGDGGEKKEDKGSSSGSSDTKGVGKPSSGETVQKTW